MKKIIALTSFLMLCAVPAFAGTLAATTAQAGYVLKADSPAATTIAKTSKGVMIGVNFAGTGYSINTYHQNGTKQFGTAYDSTAIYFKDVGTAAAFAAPASSVGAEAFGTGWTAM